MVTQIIWNHSGGEHLAQVKRAFRHAIRLDCAVAFAKRSGFRELRKPLLSFLRRGGVARFFVGSSFCLTEPEVLEELFKLSRRHDLTAHLVTGDDGEVFHPKVYRFEYVDQVKTIIGSANLTSGGLETNYECSALIVGEDGDLLRRRLDALTHKSVSEKIDQGVIDRYWKDYEIARVIRNQEKRKKARLLEEPNGSSALLEAVLAEFRADMSPDGFESQVANRARGVRDAKAIMATMAKRKPKGQRFEAALGSLRDCFHSNIIRMHFAKIVKKAPAFTEMVHEAIGSANEEPAEAYAKLSKYAITGVGPNWRSEILHAVNPTRFAVLNENSASGMRLVDSSTPRRPSNTNISPSEYGAFCRRADELVKKLRLKNMSELDAVFNRRYFSQ